MSDSPDELSRWKRIAQEEVSARKEAELRLTQRTSELQEGKAQWDRDMATRTAELVRARDEAIAAGRARTDFLARMSHEIRTPMNAVIGMAELLLMEKLDPTVNQGIQTIRSASDALLELVNDILDFSKIEAGGLSLCPEEFNLGEQVSSIIELMAVPARKRGLELRVDMDPRTSGVMFGDESRLRQVLLNLIGNAVKFTEKGFVELRIGVAEAQGDRLCLEFCVSDSGPGIPKESHEAVFEVFEQVDGSSTRRHGGTGLGLAISRRLVDLFGGRMWVQSEVGQGAEFYFTVWLRRVRNATQVPIPPWSVLLMTQDASIIDATRRLVRPTGGTVLAVAGGLAAVCQLANAAAVGRSFDVVMLSGDSVEVGTVLPTIRSLPELSSIRTVGFGVPDSSDLELTHSVATDMTDVAVGAALRALANAEGKRADVPLPVVGTRGATILIVDDNPANRAITARLLEKVGYVVQTARDGGEALSAATSSDFDLIFMDVQMPGLDGVAATERIRGWESMRGRPKVPIVGLSALTAPEELARCRLAGMDDFLTKPVRAAALFETVQRVLSEAEAMALAAGEPQRPTLAERLASDEVSEKFGDDAESVRLCLEVFLASKPEYVEQIRSGVTAGDPEALRRVGHSLAGSFVGILRPHLLEHARALEGEARATARSEGSLDGAIELSERLIGVLEEIEREVRMHMEAGQPIGTPEEPRQVT
ncbi:MAG: ATP-binding protein [Nannocystales bacterium]